MEKTNSQPKSPNASVGSNEPIEIPNVNKPANVPEPSSHQSAAPRTGSSQTSSAHQQPTSEDDPPRRRRRYYDDSDDMIERVRQARAAFEKRIRAFQGVDWPYYTKRIIKGRLRKEDAPGATEAKPSPGADASNSGCGTSDKKE